MHIIEFELAGDSLSLSLSPFLSIIIRPFNQSNGSKRFYFLTFDWLNGLIIRIRERRV